jgi:hypothetical protein
VRQLPALLETIANGGGAGLVAATGGGGAIVYGGVANAVALDIESFVYGGTRALASTTLLMAGGRGPVDMGKAGEKAVGLTGKKERIKWEGFTTKTGYRVPDHVTRFGLEEVKNVLRLSNTRQLREYLAFAEATKRTFTLTVRTTTKLAKEILELERNHRIIVRRIL